MIVLPPAADRLIARLEPLERVDDLTRDAAQSVVLGVHGVAAAVLKIHRAPAKYRRERDALRAFADAPWCPELIAVDDRARLLLTRWCPGPWPDTPAAWRRAGEVLAELHDRPAAPDPVPLAEAIARRLADAMARSEGHVDDETRDRVAGIVGDGAAFAAVERAPCHRDYAPRNWLAGADDALVVIDWEHARADDPLVDLLRLYDGPFIDRPDREAAFLAGYARPVDGDRLRRLVALHGLVTLTWGLHHGDPTYTERGRLILRRIARTPRPGAAPPR